MKLSVLGLALSGILCFSLSVSAQVYDPSPDAMTGRVRFASYFDAEMDSINLLNGNLTLDLPLFSLPGRELSTGLRLSYNAQNWQAANCGHNPCGLYTGGWRVVDLVGETPLYSPVWVSCAGIHDYWYVWWIWVDGLGTKHNYIYPGVQQVDNNNQCGSSNPPLSDNITIPESGPAISKLYTGNSSTSPVIRFKDGHSIEFSATPIVRSANGNYLVRGPDGLPVQDTLGRIIQVEDSTSCPGAAPAPEPTTDRCKRYTIHAPNGQPATFQLNYKDSPLVWDPFLPGWIALVEPRLLSITLPNGRNYIFRYDHFQGFLTKVKLPSGGFIAYDYASHPCYAYQYPTVCNDLQAGAYDYVVSRHVSYDGASVQSSWTYQRTEVDANYRDVTVTSPEGNVVVHRLLKGTGRERETTWQQSGETLKVVRQWDTNNAPQTITTIRGSMQRSTTVTYGGDDLQQKDESDWGAGAPGPPLSRTVYSYDYLNDGTFSRLNKVEVSGINPATNAFELQGRTRFYYDEFSVNSTPATVPNKGAPIGSRGNLTTIHRYKDDANFVSETFHYDDLGNRVSQTDPLGRTSTISYEDNFTLDSNHNTFAYPTSLTSPVADAANTPAQPACTGVTTQSQVTCTAYNYDTGLLTESTDPRRLKTTRTYDELGRVKTITAPNGQLTRYTYDDDALTVLEEVEVDTGSFRTTQTLTDGFYRPKKTVQFDPAGNASVDTEYDADGRVRRVSQPYRGTPSAWTTTLYDVLNRPTSVTNPDGTQLTSRYFGNAVEQRDETYTPQANNGRFFTYNGLDQLLQVEEPYPTASTPLTTIYKYYASGQLYSVNQSGQLRTFAHNWLGELISEQQPESGQATYTYYNDGLVHTRNDGHGVTTYLYDGLGRLANTSYIDGTPAVTRVYDQNGYTGFLSEIQDGLGTTDYTYTTAGDLASEQRTFTGVTATFTTSYVYDKSGRLKTIAYPSGRVVERSYISAAGTATDRPNEIRDETTNVSVLNAFQDNAAGQITNRRFGNIIDIPGTNQVLETRSYNVRNQLTGIAATFNGTSRLNQTYDYTYDGPNMGRIRARTDADAAQSVRYGYDSLYRLNQVNAANGSWGIVWNYDVWGNRTSQTPSGAANVATQTTNGWTNNHHSNFTYDAAGDVTSDGLHHYLYDAEGRITQVDDGLVLFGYDGDGRRVKKVAGGVTTYYLYGNTGLLSEFTTANTGAAQAATTNTLQYRLSEQSGTAVVLLTTSGDVMENNRVYPFGELVQNNPVSTNDQKYTTYDRGNPQQADVELDYAIARFYSNRYGRFTSPDPLLGDPQHPQTWNRYGYAANDPINYIDPGGAHFLQIGDCIYDITVFYVNDQYDSTESSFIGCYAPGSRPDPWLWERQRVMEIDAPASNTALQAFDIGVNLTAGKIVSDTILATVGKVLGPIIARIGGYSTGKAGSEAYHYTFGRLVSFIERQGLRPGTYATPNGTLSPLQAQIDLALSPNRGLRDALIRIDLTGLRQAGYEVPELMPVGRSFNMPGGGYEMQFPYAIPPEFIRVIR